MPGVEVWVRNGISFDPMKCDEAGIAITADNLAQNLDAMVCNMLLDKLRKMMTDAPESYRGA